MCLLWHRPWHQHSIVPPIRAQYLDRSEPMRVLHSATKDNLSWEARVSRDVDVVPRAVSVAPEESLLLGSFQWKIFSDSRGDISSILIGAYNRTFLCMEAKYPCAIKNQRGASKILLPSRGFGCDELVLYGIRLLAPAGKLWTNESAVM